ncbi:uncharacterized protein N7511_009201 [Penicillium nucicola]|uniref:uncharacterized protein n=1 Tax=Penicillium nucicola TaxID=1850975 RepID=UPI0025451DD6|nr:uncharacterized protein N7511_009201 [Penicillium nucicola]KAJ5747505.1 hypothetical protein N7511_009201 [Penicillium nucicola]
MTIFWLVQLQQAIVKYKVHTNEGQFPSWDDFQHVLLDTPALMNTSLWTQYYTKGHMFSTSARQSWVLPDRQPLPGLSSPTQGSLSMQSNDPDRLLRYAFEVVQHTLKTASRRGHIVKEALDSVQATTIRLRRTNSSIPPYSETQVYFWIQVVHAAIQSFEAATEDSPNENSILDIPASRLSSASFSALFNTNSSLWRQYYSEKIWNGIAARMEFVLPDLKPLPSVINPSSRSHEQSALFKQMESALLRHGPELPTVEYLSLRATWIIRGADELAASSVADSPRISSHSHLLLYLYRKLLLESQGKTLRDIALDQVEGISGPSVNSITHKTFWVQVFLTAISRVGCWQETSQDQSPKVVTFEALVRRNLQLVFEDLPGLYYTREIWSSHEASEVMIAPDRRNMPGMHCADSHELDNLFFF